MQSSDPRYAYKKLDTKTRVELLRFAQKGQPHPDSAVARAAYDWAHHEGWSTRVNQLPGWLLPAVGLSMAIVFAATGTPIVMTVGAVLVVILGLLGWNAAAAAKQVRKVYQDQPNPSASPRGGPDGAHHTPG